MTNSEVFSWFRLTHQSWLICDCRPLCVIPRTKCKRNRSLFFLNYSHTESCEFQTYRFLNLSIFYRLTSRTWNSILWWALQNCYFKIPKDPTLQCSNIFHVEKSSTKHLTDVPPFTGGIKDFSIKNDQVTTCKDKYSVSMCRSPRQAASSTTTRTMGVRAKPNVTEGTPIQRNGGQATWYKYSVAQWKRYANIDRTHASNGHDDTSCNTI